MGAVVLLSYYARYSRFWRDFAKYTSNGGDLRKQHVQRRWRQKRGGAREEKIEEERESCRDRRDEREMHSSSLEVRYLSCCRYAAGKNTHFYTVKMCYLARSLGALSLFLSRACAGSSLLLLLNALSLHTPEGGINSPRGCRYPQTPILL